MPAEEYIQLFFFENVRILGILYYICIPSCQPALLCRQGSGKDPITPMLNGGLKAQKAGFSGHLERWVSG